jgi:hypothetical protein
MWSVVDLVQRNHIADPRYFPIRKE